jgi:hypothetical protein
MIMNKKLLEFAKNRCFLAYKKPLLFLSRANNAQDQQRYD